MNIVELLAHYAIPYDRREKENVYIECPDCAKNNLSVNVYSGAWHCWSSDCEERGSRGSLPSLAEKLKISLEGLDITATPPPERDRSLSDGEREAILHAASNKPQVIEWAVSRHLDPTFVMAQGIGYDESQRAIVFPFRDEKGSLIGAKYRNEQGQWIKGMEPLLYILDPRDLRKDKLVVVEGEVDALTLKQCKIPVVATLGAGKDKGYELLKNARQLCLGYDMDDAGEAGAEKAATMLGHYRCKRITWGAKDPNDWIAAGATPEQLIEAVKSAKILARDVTSLALGDALNEYFLEHEKGIRPRRSWGWKRLDEFSHGNGGGELIGVLAESGTGKTTFILNAIKNHVAQGIRCGLASLEEHPILEITPKLYSVFLERNIATFGVSREEAKVIKEQLSMVQLFTRTITLREVIDWVKECYYVHDCKMVAIDYFQLLVPDEESVQAIKDTIFAIKNLTKEMPDLCILLVIQPKQKQRGRTKDGKEAKPMKLEGADARGGSAINQTVDKMLTICGVEGHPNITQYEYTKCRGHLNVSKRDWLGKFTQLEYDHSTLRMTELPNLIYGG